MVSASVRRILVPVDLSSCSRAALEFAGRIAPALGASLEVLHVEGSGSGPGTNERRAAEGELTSFVASAGLPKDLTPVLRLEQGDARERIVGIAKEEGFDLIVLGTHGRTGRPRSLAGSVAESVVRTASRPVVTVRE